MGDRGMLSREKLKIIAFLREMRYDIGEVGIIADIIRLVDVSHFFEKCYNNVQRTTDN